MLFRVGGVVVAVLATACRPGFSVPSSPLPDGPVFASAGTGGAFVTGTTITLDATGSLDSDGRPLTFAWQLGARPMGSTSRFADANAASTPFVLDLQGTYVFEVTVTDDLGATAQSSVTYTSFVPKITVDPGMNQSVALGTIVQLFGSYQVDPTLPVTVSWTLAEIPSKSTTTLVGADTLTPTVKIDVEGIYVIALTVATAYNSATRAVVIKCLPAPQILGYTVIDAAYSAALDRFVMVSDSPPAMHIRDLATGSETVVALGRTPSSVSIEPTGLRAVVGHNQLVSLIDLQSGAVLAGYVPPVDIGEIVFGADGRIHCIPKPNNIDPLATITMSTGAIATQRIIFPLGARLHPNGQRMYIPSAGGENLQRWDVTLSPIVFVANYTAPNSNLWFIHNGASAVAIDGSVYASTDDTTTDMTPQTPLQIPTGTDVRAVHVQESTAAGLVAVAVLLDSFDPAAYISELAMFDSTTLAPTTAIMLDDTTANGMTYKNRARFTAFSADGTKQYLIVDAVQVPGGGGAATTAFSVIYRIVLP